MGGLVGVRRVETSVTEFIMTPCIVPGSALSAITLWKKREIEIYSKGTVNRDFSGGYCDTTIINCCTE